MSPQQRRRAEELFQVAADLPQEERTAYLDRHCDPGDPLRAEVDSLLRHHDDETPTFLHGPGAAPLDDEEMIGQHIGPYKILQRIGEGGFGTVYMAEQEQPVRRKVALKIIKLGMDTRQVIARFEAERQALAMMEHPNIAKVFDAGATETGRPYFVMELVKGIPVTVYCDQNSLSMRQRLELFMQVCRAVQHAHQKGIIHRDIKPSNVMVTLHDGVPVPKVIDFGVAKATSQRLTEKTLFTEFLQFIGTPQYMSPEQAEMSGLDVDTRTDLYSLGVLLYELLTGTTPFDPTTLRRAALDEIQRMIREDEPLIPSQRVSTRGAQQATIAKLRCAEPQTLRKALRGDLDWIVMKALDKDRTRRYETAASLADDIQRHLNHEPVLAGPPGAVYKLRKFVTRHRVGVTTGSFVVLALFSGLAMATTGFVRANHERIKVVEANRRIEQEMAAAQTINAFFSEMLMAVDPMQLRLLSAFAPQQRLMPVFSGGVERDMSVAEMVRRAAENVDQAFVDKPELEATARETLGMMLRGLGRYAEAEPQLREAWQIRCRELGKNHPDAARSALALGALLLDTGRGSKALPLVESAYDGMKAAYGEAHPRTLSCASILAAVLSDQGRYEIAEDLFKRTLEWQRETLGPDHRDALVTMWNWSVSYLSQWRLVEGEALAREVSEIAARTLDPDDSLNILSKPLSGWWYLARYQYDDAEAVLRPGLEQCRRILGSDHPFTYMTMHGLARSLQGAELQDEKERLHQQALAGLRRTRGPLHWHTLSTMADYARRLDEQGHFDEAERLYRELVQDRTRAQGKTSRYTLSAMLGLAEFLQRAGKLEEAVGVWRDYVQTVRRAKESRGMSVYNAYTSMANYLVEMGRLEEARQVTRELLDLTQSWIDKNPDDPMELNTHAWLLLTCSPADMRDPKTALSLAEKAVQLDGGKRSAILDTLAFAQHKNGQNKEAIKTQRRSLDLLPQQLGSELLYGAAMVRYLLQEGDTAGADEIIRTGIEKFRAAYGEEHPLLSLEFTKAARFLARENHYSMAEALFHEGLSIARRVFGEEHERVAQIMQSFAGLYLRQGRYCDAEQVYHEVVTLRRKLFGNDHRLVAETLYALGTAHYLAGDFEAARSTIEEALEIYRRLNIEQIPVATDVRCHLAATLIELGRLDEAAPLAESSLAKNRELFGPVHWDTIWAAHEVGRIWIQRDRLDEAEQLLRAAVANFETLREVQPLSLRGLCPDDALGHCLVQQGRYSEAEPLLLDCYRRLFEQEGEAYLGTRQTLDHIVELYEKWGQPDQAEHWRARRTPTSKARGGTYERP